MSTILIFFIFGIVLLAADVFVASFILAICGGVCFVGGCVVVFQKYGLMDATLASVGALLLLVGTVYFELVILPKTRFGKGLIVESTSGTLATPQASNDIIGKLGEALTTLAPSGYIQIEGKRYDAFSQSGHVTKGTQVIVVGLDNFRLIVSHT
ncbi:MAG: serine protease [Verrucomicrobia bacterium]|jgi:membrane-bound serine protease (ClpP class)|nr:MAG: serine protease [Verrucomicrobiota bacterium]